MTGRNATNVTYRGNLLVLDPLIVEAYAAGANRSLLAYGLPTTNYTLQYATNLSTNVSGIVTWYPLLGYTLTNSFQSFPNLPTTNPAIFYRIKR